MKASIPSDGSISAPIEHGGGLIAARRRFPHAPEPWIDLSTGINPVPYALPPLPPAALTRLPEPEHVAALEAVAARAYGVADPACVVAAPGTQALIHLLPRLMPPGTVAVLSPTYAEHRAAWAQAGHSVTEGTGLVAGAAVTVVVRPNNPDGMVYSADSLLNQTGLVVVDEAFADLEGCSLAAAVPHPGLILLRSFGKTYGLAGVRLGFALASVAWAARLREALGPWSVSGPAVHAGLHALGDADWRQCAAGRLQRDAERLDSVMAARGCRIIGGTRLFRLYEHPGASELADGFEASGILVRRFTGRPHLLRLGLPAGPEEWDRLRSSPISGSSREREGRR